MNARGFRSDPRLDVSGPRLFLIQGHCVLVSINTEINTTLQSAPFINGVTHLMSALLTHIHLPSRRGPSRNRRQLLVWTHSALAVGRSSHSANTSCLEERGKCETSRLRMGTKTHTSFTCYSIGFLWILFFEFYLFSLRICHYKISLILHPRPTHKGGKYFTLMTTGGLV